MTHSLDMSSSGNVSNGNQAEEVQMTHILDRSSCRQCQQWKSSRGSEEVQMTHKLDRSSCRQCQQWKSSKGGADNSHPGWEFM